MTMTIAMVEAPLPADAPRQALLSEEIVVALVTAIAAGPYRHEPGICLFVDDHQLGYDASWVSPAAVDAALATLAEPLAGQAREAVAGVLAFAKADGWSLCIRTNADRKWMPSHATDRSAARTRWA